MKITFEEMKARVKNRNDWQLCEEKEESFVLESKLTPYIKDHFFSCRDLTEKIKSQFPEVEIIYRHGYSENNKIYREYFKCIAKEKETNRLVLLNCVVFHRGQYIFPKVNVSGLNSKTLKFVKDSYVSGFLELKKTLEEIYLAHPNYRLFFQTSDVIKKEA